MKNYNEVLKARELANEGKIREAAIILNRLCELKPNQLMLKFELACILIKNKDTKIYGILLFEELLDTRKKPYAMIELAKLELEEGNINKARKYFEETLDTESKTFAIYNLGKLELDEGNIEKSKYYFKKLLNMASEENTSFKLRKIDLKNIKLALFQLIYLEIKNKNYTKAYNYYKKLISDFYSDLNKKQLKELKEIKFYLKYKLNILKKYDKKNTDYYFFKQLLNYDEEKTLEHIKLHLDENNYKKNHTIYNETLNINIVFNDIKIKICYMSPYTFTFVDKYIVEYDYIIGSVNNIETNIVEVVTFSNTKNILTMYPVIKKSKKDINNEINSYEEKNIESYKVKQIKRESQIDKFNRKYGLK